MRRIRRVPHPDPERRRRGRVGGHNWPGEEWSRGGPVGYAGPGVLHDYATTLRAPVGPIHWAGTETATFWNGYMEGAVQAGERAAREVIDCL
ncbi:MAG: FAD-dependent oxidoreductase [Acidobacteriaceae bacterium]